MCQRGTKIILGLSVSALLFGFPVIDYNRKIPLNLIYIRLGDKNKIAVINL